MTFGSRCPSCSRRGHYVLNRSVRGSPRSLPTSAPFRDQFSGVRHVSELGCNCGAVWPFTIPWSTYVFAKVAA